MKWGRQECTLPNDVAQVKEVADNTSSPFNGGKWQEAAQSMASDMACKLSNIQRISDWPDIQNELIKIYIY